MTITLNPSCDGDGCSCGPVASNDDVVYYGGDFTNIGGSARTRCAKVDGSGTCDTAFTCSANDTVFALALDTVNSVLWVGGQFTTINGGAEKALVGVSPSTGTVLYSCGIAYTASPPAIVRRLVIDAAGGYVYAIGAFTLVGATTVTHAARFSLTTGAFDSSWNPVCNDVLSAVAVDSSHVYLAGGGGFTSLNGTAITQAGTVDKTTGTTTGTWLPNPYTSGATFSLGDILVNSATSIFLTGNFQKMGGIAGTVRNGLCEVDGSGTVTSWDPGAKIIDGQLVQQPGGVCLTTKTVTNFYCGGYFITSAAGTGPAHMAQFTYAGAIELGFFPLFGTVSDIVRSMQLSPDGTRLYIATSGANDQSNAYDASTGALDTTFDANPNNSCWAVAVTDPTP